MQKEEKILQDSDRQEAVQVDVDAAWQTFQSCYHTPEGEELSLYPCELPRLAPSKAGRVWRGVCVAATAACLVLIFTLPVCGKQSLLRLFGKWTDDKFGFASPQNVTVETQLGETAAFEKEALQQLYEAVAAMAPNSQVVPRWLPEGFGDFALTRDVSEDPVVIGSFSGEAGTLTLRYGLRESTSGLISGEDGEILEINGVVHRLFFGADGNRCAWACGDLECSISGDISREDLITMIKSVYII